MPDEQAAGAPQQGASPGAPPQQGASPTSSQGQASGVGGASMPVPNRGIEAAAMARLAIHVQGMQTLLAMLPAGGDMAGDIRKAVTLVAKHIPPGGVNQGVQMTEAQRNLMQQRQMGPQIAAMRASQMNQAPAQPQQPPAG